MASSYTLFFFFFFMFFCDFAISSHIASATEEDEYVLTLDHSNFSQVVSKHKFIVVEFYAPWCGHCKNLAPEYEKAASVLSSHDPPVALAKILKNGGEVVQDYKGPREADGIVQYLNKQVGPASFEIKTPEDAANHINDKKVVVVGIFPALSGEEFDNFNILADKLRSDYDFRHTTKAELLPRGKSSVTTPTVRLLKPFDELFIDFQKFDVDALEKFVEDSSIPLVTLFDQSPTNQPFLVKYFESPNAKKSKYTDVAGVYKGKGLSFLLGDLKDSQAALEFFGIKEDQTPVVIVQKTNGLKFINLNVEVDQIAPWLKDYMDGKVKPFIKSEPIPETNDEPVKVVVANSLGDMVLDSKKNILLEFYAPWCGHCKKVLAPTWTKWPSPLKTTLDASNNDIPSDTFEVQGYPTLYFRSSSGKVVPYEGNRTKEDIIDFIQKHREGDETTTEPGKDEL
ncbi:putative protein disulfide-isomerase [Helianthus annuus]|nr:putative protein disulfide-isomerase [Helianthus annuus]